MLTNLLTGCLYTYPNSVDVSLQLRGFSVVVSLESVGICTSPVHCSRHSNLESLSNSRLSPRRVVLDTSTSRCGNSPLSGTEENGRMKGRRTSLEDSRFISVFGLSLLVNSLCYTERSESRVSVPSLTSSHFSSLPVYLYYLCIFYDQGPDSGWTPGQLFLIWEIYS